ncbi:MAG: hypothetical protein J1F42_09485 [Lachnospiraceae bacterium]|nr:hypothetical protein [Lachnospiraceae bacterium]
MSQGKLGMRIGESVFCIGYLLFDVIAGIIFLIYGSGQVFILYGVMTLLLGFGDAFHLIPRVIKHIKGESERVKWWMDFGLAVTSITMTVFYIILLYIWKMLNVSQSNQMISEIVANQAVSEYVANQRISALAAGCTGVIWSMALARIALCLIPQNDWFGNGNKKLSMCRNTIFSIIGIAEIILFVSLGSGYGITMAVCIFLSFLLYFPVTLFAKENPKIGMLMIPKTIMYIIMISLGLAMLG